MVEKGQKQSTSAPCFNANAPQLATTKYFFISCTNKHFTTAGVLKTTEKLHTATHASPVAQQTRAGKSLPAVPVLQKLSMTDEPKQLRSVAPFQFMAAGPVIQLLTMKGADRSRRTDGSEAELRAEVEAAIATGDLGTIHSAANQIRISISNRLDAGYHPLDEGHQARITLEEELKADLDAAIKLLTPAPKVVAKPAPKKGGGGGGKGGAGGGGNPFAALALLGH